MGVVGPHAGKDLHRMTELTLHGALLEFHAVICQHSHLNHILEHFLMHVPELVEEILFVFSHIVRFCKIPETLQNSQKVEVINQK